jgi:uncharacterized membrane protein YdfJ with MMPL/SSD domain
MSEIFKFIADHPIISLLAIAAILATITIVVKGILA